MVPNISPLPMTPAGDTEPDTHCKSVELSIFKKSCLALSKMSGSSLGTSSSGGGGGGDHALLAVL